MDDAGHDTALSPVAGSERTTAMDIDKLIVQHIDEDPEWREPEHARLRASGIPVWAVIGYYQAAGGRAELVAADYQIAEEAVRAAVAYYHRHQPPIDAVLTLNRASA